LLVDAAVADRFLPTVGRAMAAQQTEIRGCPRTCALVPSAQPATEADFRTEHLALVLNIKVVAGLAEAVAHIETCGSHHSDAIITADEAVARSFLAQVDSACVYWNASTRFTDGGEFGFGAEVGISTDRLHARGPMGIRELTTWKFEVVGNGQIRR
jgi:glutamate-5-semialdehyde dehydrogenase